MVRWLMCLLGMHDYTVRHKYTPALRRLGCTRCKREWGMDDSTMSLVPWDSELEAACSDLEG